MCNRGAHFFGKDWGKIFSIMCLQTEFSNTLKCQTIWSNLSHYRDSRMVWYIWICSCNIIQRIEEKSHKIVWFRQNSTCHHYKVLNKPVTEGTHST